MQEMGCKMFTLAIKLIIFIFIATPFLYAQNAQNETISQEPNAAVFNKEDLYVKKGPLFVEYIKEEKENKTFFDVINQKVYAATVEKKEEKKILRAKWKTVFGVDLFYPYYKAKEIEDWITDRFKIKFFKMSGKPKLADDQFKYTFTSKF